MDGKMLVVAIFVLVEMGLSLGAAASGQCVCGIRQSRNDSVVPGEQIEPGEWPWQVGIYWWQGSKLNPPSRICEGVLMNGEGWVLTSANCLKDTHGNVLKTAGMVGHVGLVALQQNTEGSRRFGVGNVKINDELDLALVRLKVEDDEEWEGMPICFTYEMEEWDLLYGRYVYVLQQSHRHRLGGFEIVKLQLEKEVICHGLTLTVKAKAISDNNIKLKTRGTHYRDSARGTPLYIYKPEGWSLLGISNKVQPSLPGKLCQPGDYESFLSFSVDQVHEWIASELDEGFNSVETSTE
ncbi:serine protease 28-like [Uranotaenia lowii]|uniref:serine protease 28-like n=1 Tax=Uranotaenia lowii TaxID=190385 RepID=UPI00247AF28E|nr:serine protease 28-like [Uranotaenia lowii]XP_055602897.1 serine protease 28-like [Uranotaenia lowii]